MDLMTAFSTVSAALKTAKDLKDIKALADSSEAMLKVAEIQIALTDAKIALSEAKQKIADLELKMQEKERYLDSIGKLKRVGEVFFDEEHSVFKCSTCIEVRGVPVTLTLTRQNGPYLDSPSCKARFRNPNYVSQPLPRRAQTSGNGGF